MADKENQPELTPWQQHHAEFQKKKQEEAAKKAREEKRKKQPEKVASVIEKYEATPSQAIEYNQKKTSGFLRWLNPSNLDQSDDRAALSEILRRMWPFILVSILILCGSLYVISPLSKIDKFSTSGNTHETTEQIAEVTGIKTNDHVWKIVKNRKQITSSIEKAFPRIKTADLKWSFPNHFNVKMTEYAESAYLKLGDTYQLVLSNGNILSKESVDPQKLAAYPVLENFNPSEVKAFVKAYETLNAKIKAQVTTVTKVPTKVTSDFIALDMKDGHQVRVPLSQMSEKLPYYTSVASNLTEPSVIDMEAGVYAKSKAAYQQDLEDDQKKEEEKNKEKTAESNASTDESNPDDASQTDTQAE